MTKWTYIAVYDDDAADAFKDFDNAIETIYGLDDFEQPVGWKHFRFLTIRCETEAGVTYEEMSRDDVEDRGIQLRKEYNPSAYAREQKASYLEDTRCDR